MRPIQGTIMLLPLVLVAGAGCRADGAEHADPPADVAAELAGDVETPAEFEVRMAAARGLPVRLLPADFGTPDYVAPRMTCAPVLRDSDSAGTELHLVQQHMRHDKSQLANGTRAEKYAEGLYEVRPQGQYGLETGQLLRVNCARQSATAVVSRLSHRGGPGES